MLHKYIKNFSILFIMNAVNFVAEANNQRVSIFDKIGKGTEVLILCAIVIITMLLPEKIRIKIIGYIMAFIVIYIGLRVLDIFFYIPFLGYDD